MAQQTHSLPKLAPHASSPLHLNDIMQANEHSAVIPDEWQGVLILARLIPCCQHFVEPKERPKKSWHHRQAELKAITQRPCHLPQPEASPPSSQTLPSGDAAMLPSPFEISMDEIAASSSISCEKRTAFAQYLLSNPCNIALRASHLYGNPTAADWPSALAAVISSSQAASVASPSVGSGAAPQHISWELLLCLMRNILCHEHCFDFSNVKNMWKEALQCFGSVSVLENVLQQYAGFVEGRASATLAIYRQYFPPERHLHWWQLLVCLRLVVCRCNNAIVDDRFEQEMTDLVEGELQLSDDAWAAFGLYLVSHPANPDQNGTNPADLSWMMTFRLMRNIVCHERSFAFAFTAELYAACESLFRSAETLERALTIYRSCCHTSLNALLADSHALHHWTSSTSSTSSSSSSSSSPSKRRLSLLRIQPVASIQLQNPSSCAILLSSSLKLAHIVLGADTLCRWAKTISEGSRPLDPCVAALIGEPRSGKSLSALYIATVISCPAGVPASFCAGKRRKSSKGAELRFSSGEVLHVPLARVTTWQTLSVTGRVERLHLCLDQAAEEQAGLPFGQLLDRARSGSHAAVITVVVDDLNCMFTACGPEDVQELRRCLASFFSLPSLRFVVTAPPTFLTAALRSSWPFLRSFPMNALATRESLYADTELLIRHYYRIDKWKLRSLATVPVSPIDLLGVVFRALMSKVPLTCDLLLTVARQREAEVATEQERKASSPTKSSPRR